MSKQIVLRLELNCEKCKRRAMKTLAGISGVDSIDIKANESQIVVNGNADPVCLTASLRKFGFAELVSVGPLKMEKEKKEKEDKQEKINCVVLPKCCDRCSGYTYYWREETVYSCSIQ